jgi:hypothetical protein
MNLGLIVGKVLKPEGDEAVPEGEVYVKKILGGGGKQIGFIGPQGQKQMAHVDVDSDGTFQLPFGWSGAEFAEDLSVVNISLYGGWTETTKPSSRVTIDRTLSHGYVTFRGYLIENVSCRIGLALPDVQSVQGLAEFAKSLIEAYRKVRGSLPILKVDAMSTECKLILSAGNIRTAWSD